MRFGVLGPVVVDPPGDSGLGGPRQRRLLAALLADRGRIVSADRLTEIVFAGEPTEAAAGTLRTYVARLRRSLGGNDASIETAAPGYRLDIGSGTVDAELFEDALSRTRILRSEERIAEALDAIAGGLRLWRGTAYAEFADEDWIQPEAIRLDGLRVEAEEIRLACLLDIGRHEEAVPALTAFVETHPLRESARLLLVTALYRTGRQADALRAADTYRHVLADVGLEPTEEFEHLEERVVVQDPDLRLAPPTGRHLRGYRLVDRLGGDEHAEVHTALQPGIDRLVAVTSYPAAIADHPTFIREFDTRVREVARLDHPALVEILDFWREPGTAHLVTRHARGGNLAERLEKGPLPADTVARITVQVAGGLAEAHTHGLWHGSLRPEHILFDEDGGIRVAGVGTSEIIDAISGEPDVLEVSGPGTDQLDLARIVQRALTGFDPGGSGSRRVSSHRPELLALDGVLARAAAPNHADRYTDIAGFARSLADAVGADAPAPVAVSRINPYKGLRPFRETDSADFFGREAMVAELVSRLATERFVTVVGASGSGKSSVVLAGVVPQIRSARQGPAPLVASMVPGSSPFDELTRALRSVVPLERGAGLDAAIDGVHRTISAAVETETLVLVIDQLEELWTLVGDPTERTRFLTGLMDAIDEERLAIRVVATLRADFFDRPLQHHRLGEAVSHGSVVISAMSPAEIERAIVEPAAAVGVTVERPVVAELVADVVDQPSALPLLQFSLTELFEACDGVTISMEDHTRLGGVGGAIAQRAERLYGDAPPTERDLIRAMCLRLVTVGEGAADLRRRADRSELLSASPDPAATERVIDRFGAARLLTFDRNPQTRAPTVEIAHEALLRHWPRLRTWVDEASEYLKARVHLTAAAAGWEATGRERGELYRGPRLEAVADWRDRADLTDVEHDFLGASLDARAEEEDAERRQLAMQMHVNRRLRRSLTAVGVVLVVALIAGFLAVSQRDRARSEAIRAEETLGRQLSTIATERVATDRSLALLLAVEGSRLDTSTAVRRGLLDALGGTGLPFTRTVIPTPADDYVALAVSPDAQTAVAKRADGTIDVVDLETRDVIVAGLAGPASPFGGIDISDDGALVVVSGSDPDGTGAVVRSLPDGDEIGRIAGRTGGLHQAVFVPGTQEIILADSQGIVTIHATDAGQEIRRFDPGQGLETTVLAAAGSTVYVVELSPPGGPLTSWLTAWDIATGARLAGPAQIDDDVIVQAAVSGDTVITAGERMRAFDATTLEQIGGDFRGSSEGDHLFGLAVGPDGLVAAGSFNNLELWAGIGGPEDPFLLTSGGSAVGAWFSSDGGTLVTADPDGTISTRRVGWNDDIGTPMQPLGPGNVTVSPTGEVVSVWGRGRGLQLFDRASLAHLGGLEGLGPDHSFLGVAFSPDGRHVATLTCPADLVDQDCPATIEVFDVAARRRAVGPAPAGPVWWLVGNVLAYTPDGEGLAVGSAETAIRLFEASSLQEPEPSLDLSEHFDPGSRLTAVATGTSDGRSLLAAVNDIGHVTIWDITGDPEPIGAIRVPSSAVIFGPDGELYIGTVAGSVQVWDPLTIEPRGEQYRASEGAWRLRLAGDVLVVSRSVGGTELFDLESTQRLSGVLPSWAADVDIDGKRIFLGGLGFDQGGTDVRVLPLDLESLVSEACHHAGRNMTAEEWAGYMPANIDHRPTCPNWPLPGD